MARALARSGHDVIAIDADVNPMLGISLGLGMDCTEQLAGIRQELSEHSADDALHAHTIEGLVDRFGADAPDGVRVVVASRVDMPDHGCLCCGVSADRLLREMEGDGRTVLGDLEAGVGVLTRMESGSLDLVLVVVNPTPKSIEVARRAVEAAVVREIRVLVVANRVAGDDDLEAIRDVLGAHDIVVVPEDPVIARADAEGLAPIDVDATAPGVRAIVELCERLVAQPA
jgi:CO dehydrogenase maturation factor